MPLRIKATCIDHDRRKTRDARRSVLVVTRDWKRTMSTSGPAIGPFTNASPIKIKWATRTLQGGPVSSKVRRQSSLLKNPDSIGRKEIGNARYWENLARSAEPRLRSCESSRIPGRSPDIVPKPLN